MILKYLRIILITGLLLSTLFVVSSTSLKDPISTNLRSQSEVFINQTIENLLTRAEQNQLTVLDKALLHSGALLGMGISYWSYPEATQVLWHYIYGDGSALELKADYFKSSAYLNQQVKQLGSGTHGALTLKQQQDWRLSLVFNPYYLKVTPDEVIIFQPQLDFAPLRQTRRFTLVPLGLMKVKVYDNLIHALNPKPFKVFAKWSR